MVQPSTTQISGAFGPDWEAEVRAAIEAERNLAPFRSPRKRGRPPRQLFHFGSSTVVRSAQDTTPFIQQLFRERGLTRLPTRAQLEAWALTSKPGRLARYKTPRGGTWEIWRRAYIENEKLVVLAAIRHRESGKYLTVPLTWRWDAQEQCLRLFIDGHWVENGICKWPELYRHLKKWGLFDSVQPSSGLIFSRVVAAVAGQYCRFDEAMGNQRLEVAHLDQWAINDNIANLKVMTKGAHNRYDKGKKGL